MFHRFFVTALLAILCSFPAPAAVVNTLVLNGGTGGAFVNGGRYESAFNDLNDPLLFGAGTGVIDYGFNFLTEVTSLSGVSFTNVDLLILTSRNSLLGTADIAAADSFVRSGGRLLAMGTSLTNSFAGSLSQTLANRAALTDFSFSTNSQYNTNNGNAVQFSSPGNSTPFGTGAGTLIARDVNVKLGSQTGSIGTPTIGTSFSSGAVQAPDGYFGEVTGGRFLFMTSVNAFGTESIGASTYNSRYGDTANAQYFLNSIAWLTEGSASAVPEPSTSAMMCLSCLVLGRSAVKRQRKRITDERSMNKYQA